MICGRSIPLAAFMTCLLAAATFAQDKAAPMYCPVYLIGQYFYNGTYMWYYACQVCDQGKPDNCTEQNVFFQNQVDCSGGGCSCCSGGGTCTGDAAFKALKTISPNPDDPNGLDAISETDTAYADATSQHDFIVASPSDKTAFIVTVSDNSAQKAAHYFECFLISHRESGRYLCLGRELKNTPNNPPPAITTYTKRDPHHVRVAVTDPTGKHPGFTPYCYLTIHDPTVW